MLCFHVDGGQVLVSTKITGQIMFALDSRVSALGSNSLAGIFSTLLVQSVHAHPRGRYRDTRVTERAERAERGFRLFTHLVEARIRTHLWIAAHGVSQMLRAIRLFSLLLLGTGVTFYSPPVVAQTVKAQSQQDAQGCSKQV